MGTLLYEKIKKFLGVGAHKLRSHVTSSVGICSDFHLVVGLKTDLRRHIGLINFESRSAGASRIMRQNALEAIHRHRFLLAFEGNVFDQSGLVAGV